jgi:acetyltransferase-like isoleucine patch superfamily enzyme
MITLILRYFFNTTKSFLINAYHCNKLKKYNIDISLSSYVRINNSADLTLGKDIKLGESVYLEIKSSKGKLNIGNSSYIANNCKLTNNNIISFGKKTNIAEHCHIITSDQGKLIAKDSFSMQECVKLIVHNQLSVGNNVTFANNAKLKVFGIWVMEDSTTIGEYTQIAPMESGYKGNLKLHKNSSIGPYCWIDLSNNITFEQGSVVGPFGIIYTHNHNYSEAKDRLSKGSVTTAPVVIGKNSWVGAKVTILPGITIGHHSVVAAGSVVTKNVEPYSVYAGNPAKKIKDINNKHLQNE